MVLFPSDEWIKIFKEKLNENKKYREVAQKWEGDFLFVITPDKQYKKTTVFYIDLYHGRCKQAYLVGKDVRTADFVFKGSFSNWKKVIKNEIDPIRGLIRGMFTVEGDSKKIIDNVKAAQELVNTATKIETDFEN